MCSVVLVLLNWGPVVPRVGHSGKTGQGDPPVDSQGAERTP